MANKILQQMKKAREANREKSLERVKNQGKKFSNDHLWKPLFDKNNDTRVVYKLQLLRHPDDEYQMIKKIDFVFKCYTNDEGERIVTRNAYEGGKGVGDWIFETSRETIKEKCPLWEYNGNLLAQGKKDSTLPVTFKNCANVLVIDDPKNPENNGKVFLWEFGNSIKNILDEQYTNMELEDEEGFDPFDIFEDGGYLKLVVKLANNGFVDYGQSKVLSNESYDGFEEYEDAIAEGIKSLDVFYKDPSNFKDYDTLKSKLDSVLSGTKPNDDFDDDDDDFDEKPKKKSKSKKSKKKDDKPKNKSKKKDDDDDFDDDFDDFDFDED